MSQQTKDKIKDFIIAQARREWVEGVYSGLQRHNAVEAIKDLDAIERAEKILGAADSDAKDIA